MLRRRLPAFSLIELALVLIIIGVLAGAVFKGQDVLEAAKIRSVLNDIDRIRSSAALYRDTYGQWPGNDSQAKARFGADAVNGSGNGLINGEESHQFWVHLGKAGHSFAGTAPSSKLGGRFEVEGDMATRQNILILASHDKSGVLTPKQASVLKAKVEEQDPGTGQIIVAEGANAALGSCVRESKLNLTNNTPSCILRVELR
jgi:hypothetical protein